MRFSIIITQVTCGILEYIAMHSMRPVTRHIWKRNEGTECEQRVAENIVFFSPTTSP